MTAGDGDAKREPARDAPPVERAGPVARLLGSLANALLDLGLPTIRGWLRDRLGPDADVAQVTTDGSLVHLDGVRVPIGSRGVLRLDRATAVLVPLGRAGLPEMRLHAFTGVLAFGDDASPDLRADVSFVASAEPDEHAWIAGELTITRLTWALRGGVPRPSGPIAMRGRAQLFVSSQTWRLDDGALEGEVVRATLSGAGVFERDGEGAGREDETAPVAPSIVPRAIARVTLTLAQARVGPFLDAAAALTGRWIDVPPFVPLDAQLDGTLAWDAAAGGQADLRIVAASIRAQARATVQPDGEGLRGDVTADVALAPLLRGLAVPREALPREEDALVVGAHLRGSIARPELSATLRAGELGFRLGRPRFVPPLTVRDVTSEVFVKDGRVVARAAFLARTATVLVDLDARLDDPSSTRGTLRAGAIEAAFLRDLMRTLGASVVIPDDATSSVDLALGPWQNERALSGTATVATPRSRITLTLTPGERPRLEGVVTAADALAAGFFRGAVRPAEGAIDFALEVDRNGTSLAGRGTARAERLVLVVSDRAPWVLERATVSLAVDRSTIAYEGLRFQALGASVVARGAIPLSGAPDERPRIALRLDGGGIELFTAIRDLVRAELPDSIALPADLGLSGELAHWVPAEPDGRVLSADVLLATPRGSSLTLGVRWSASRAFDGSTVRGAVAVSDLVESRALPGAYVLPEGTVTIAATVDGRGEDVVALGVLKVDRLGLRTEDDGGAPLAVTDAAAPFRLDRRGVAWKDAEAQVAGGRLACTGTFERDGRARARVRLSGVPVHGLPSVKGRLPSAFVRGEATGTVTIAIERGRSVRAAGALTLDDARFPALDLLRPTLARYGLRPPNEDAAGPVTATLVATDWGLFVRDLAVDLRGASVRGHLAVAWSRLLEGKIEITLEEEYLRTSKLLTLPRVLTERLVVPLHLDGTIDRPEVHAELGTSLRRALAESHIAQLFGAERPPKVSRREPPPPFAEAIDAELDAAIEAHRVDWDRLASG